jgi:hypothetical protein
MFEKINDGRSPTSMTSQEMLQIILAQFESNIDSEIVGEPRLVPHGGIAIDTRSYKRRTFSIACYQFYGTEDTLDSALEILKDHNVDLTLGGDYVQSMSKNVLGRKIDQLSTVKVFPMEDPCVGYLAAIEKTKPKLDYSANYVFMNPDGLFKIGFKVRR